ncbi:uncharacterized protein LOC143228517 [Tachypleus tridentatus]|uniref:uncharacterized protein LOC143228517 n=1 Tax=Tachypleus tridentatus TaxID=6853 RepID=UPI003FD0D478
MGNNLKEYIPNGLGIQEEFVVFWGFSGQLLIWIWAHSLGFPYAHCLSSSRGTWAGIYGSNRGNFAGGDGSTPRKSTFRRSEQRFDLLQSSSGSQFSLPIPAIFTYTYEINLQDGFLSESLRRVQELTGKSLTFYKVDLLDKEGLENIFCKNIWNNNPCYVEENVSQNMASQNIMQRE